MSLHLLQSGVMLPLKEKDKPIVQKLLSAGCCARCVLRFCCVSVQAAYRKPAQVRLILHEEHVFPHQPAAHWSLMPLCFFHLTQDTLKELQAFISSTENPKTQDAASAESTDENNKSHDAAVSEPPEDPPSKRAKLEAGPSEEDAAAAVKLKDEESRVCVVCLGILQDLCGPAQALKVCVRLNIHSFQTQQCQRSVREREVLFYFHR